MSTFAQIHICKDKNRLCDICFSGFCLYLLCESLSWTVLPSSPTCPGGPTTNWQASPHSWQSWRPLGNSNKMLVTQTLHTLTVYKHTVAVYNTCYVCIDVFSWPPIVFCVSVLLSFCFCRTHSIFIHTR